MKTQFYAGVALATLLAPGIAFAQSTGSIEIEEEIVVTAQKVDDGIEGLAMPESQKPRVVVGEELIGKQGPGQSILNTINQVPGVNFTNSDAYGSSGGNLRIRGFDGNRISLTFDGFPLNDTGNYAIFSNQQLDPELIKSVNVNLGTTDVDSPTASAAGGTVNYLTRDPSKDMGGLVSFSMGEDSYYRIFGKVDTGELTSSGTRVFLAASKSRNDKFKGPGKIDKTQFNFRLFQPLGGSGDFVAITGHYNRNRNNFYRNPTLAELRLVAGRPDMVNVGGLTKAARNTIYAFDNFASCTKTLPGAGAQNDNSGALPNGTPTATGGANNILNTSSCTNFYGVRVNPSNTGNVHLNSRYTLTDKLRLTVDAGWFYVLANGGGSTAIAENNAIVRGASTATGKDLNGDGDVLDTIRFYTPNTTNTRRLIVLSSLIYDINDDHRVRLAYTFDRGRHRQTGQWGYLDARGFPESVFGGLKARPVQSVDGADLRQRDRLSIALLNQISGEYRGQFMDDALTVTLGLRMPFFKRELNNYCYTQTGGSGFATCTSQPVTALTIVAPTAAAPFPANALFAPFTATYKFSPVLPSAGFNFKVTDDLSLFGSYAKGFSAPRTDNLYRAPIVTVDPETTDTFDLGLRYTTSTFQAQATAWHTNYKNRIVTSFDQTQGISVDRNVGSVKAKGVDIGMAVRPYSWFTFQGNVSYNSSKFQDDVQVTSTVFLPTSGKQMAETPKWQAGYRAEVEKGPFAIGLQVKYVADRFATDVNDIKSSGYTLADMDMRFNLKQFGMEGSWIQLNVSNLFDRFYLGNISTQIAGPSFTGGANPNWSIGAPRTISGTVRVAF